MPPMVYCDNNFVITAHDSPNEYKAHLRELATAGKVRFVLSPWHWQEMASDADHARGTSMADFCDSLNPGWLFDRRSIQKKEVAAAFYRFAHIPADPPAMVGDIGEIIYDLIRTRAYRSCRAFVEHLRGIGPNHPIETAFKNALEANQRNSLLFLAGKLTPKLLAYFERRYVQGLLPYTTPSGVELDEGTKREFLSSYTLNDCPAIALETKITYESWTLKRKLKRNTFLDQQHVMAVPYADLFITDDGQLANLTKRAVNGLPFRTAQIVTKMDFDSRFPPPVPAKTV